MLHFFSAYLSVYVSTKNSFLVWNYFTEFDEEKFEQMFCLKL